MLILSSCKHTEDNVEQIKMLDVFCKEKNDGKYSNFHALVQAHKDYIESDFIRK